MKPRTVASPRLLAHSTPHKRNGASRMSVTKRTRFEVLRRDEHTCQYCGAKAPDVMLHVDHVMPVSLGGSDRPDNLVAACKDCNTGKASIAPDSPLAVAVGAKAAAYALGMTDKMTRLRASIEQADEYVTEFEDAWNAWKTTIGNKTIPLPADYESSLHRWFNMGVPFRLIELAIKKAMATKGLRGEFAEFTYMAGIVWNRINADEIDLTLDAANVAVFTEFEVGDRIVEAYEAGRKSAAEAAVAVS